MEDLNEIKEIVVTVKDEIIDKMETLRGFLENPVDFIKYASLAKEIKNLIKEKAPFLYPEWKFWDNIDKFFNSGILSDDDKCKLIGKLSNEKEKHEVGRKIVDFIGKVDTDKKLVYIINATKAWVDDVIDRPQYFRICHVLSSDEEWKKEIEAIFGKK